MSESYQRTLLEPDQAERLQRIYVDLFELAQSAVPSVRAAARASLPHIAQALNGQGMAYELYTKDLPD